MDLIQGHPDLVAMHAQEMQATAETLDEASRTVSRLADGGSHSKAMTELSVAIRELASVLVRAHNRYQPAGDALAAFAPQLRLAMHVVSGAVSATDAIDVGAAQGHADQALALEAVINANPLANQSSRDDAHHALHAAVGHLEDQKSALANAQNHYESALHDLHVAAQRARDQIDDGIGDSGLNDTFNDRVQSVVNHMRVILSKALEAIHKILSKLSLVLGMMALIVTVCGFPELAWVPKLLQLAVTLEDINVEFARYSMHDITFGTLMASLIFSVATLVTLGVAKTISVAGKAVVSASEKEVVSTSEKAVTSTGEGTPLTHEMMSGPEIAKEVGKEAGQDSISIATEDPLAQWFDSFAPPPHVTTYSDVDPKQIAEQAGIDVPGHLRVVQASPAEPVVVTSSGSRQMLTVTSPEHYQGQLRVYSSSQP